MVPITVPIAQRKVTLRLSHGSSARAGGWAAAHSTPKPCAGCGRGTSGTGTHPCAELRNGSGLPMGERRGAFINEAAGHIGET